MAPRLGLVYRDRKRLGDVVARRLGMPVIVDNRIVFISDELWGHLQSGETWENYVK